MTDRSAQMTFNRFAACFAAAGFLFAAAPAALAQTQLPPPAYGQADTRQDRIEELENQLREATAENERLQHQLIQTQRENTRLRGLVGELAGVNQSLAEGQTDASTSTQTGVAPNPAPVQTGSLGTLPASQLPGDAGQAYTRARELLLNGRYAEAEVAFSEFLSQFPEADTAADARFWYGFTLLARNNYQSAASAFVTYLQTTPRGARAPEAQVRLGMALAGMGQQRQACAAFSALPRQYPNAPANVRALATRESRASNCPA